MIASPIVMSAHELLTYDSHGRRTELVKGTLIVREPVGGAHAGVLFELSVAFGVYLRTTNPVAGRVLVGDPGFWLAHDPDTVRAPDLAFLSTERLEGGKIGEGFLQGVPDLAVEIRSPHDRAGALLQKVGEWLEAGTPLVWVIDPRRKSAQIFHADGTVVLVGPNDALDGTPVLPGFVLPLASLWVHA
jgi:Uma2 family endonuclease